MTSRKGTNKIDPKNIFAEHTLEVRATAEKLRKIVMQTVPNAVNWLILSGTASASTTQSLATFAVSSRRKTASNLASSSAYFSPTLKACSKGLGSR